MNKDELIKKAIFTYPDSNGVYIQYLLPVEANLLSKKSICGYHMLVFKSKEMKDSWMEIYNALKQCVVNNFDLKNLINFEPIYEIDEKSVLQDRGFNEAYTTNHYKEFLEDGDCKPNKEIIKDLYDMHLALINLNIYYGAILNEKNVIENLMFECFIKPNGELHWGDHWTLHIPPISSYHIEKWESKKQMHI